MLARTRSGRAAAALAAAALAVTGIGGTVVSADASPTQKPRPRDVKVQLLSFNDFHGHLETSTPGDVEGVAAGGSEYLATHLAALREGNRNSFTVAAGDMIGGSPFLSGLFHDEPAVESLNALGLDFSGVGNHEFDEGVKELRRMQRGGCHPVDGCYFPDAPFAGADFKWLAANVVNDRTGRTPLRPVAIRNVRGIKLGFIGMTLEGTDQLVSQDGIQGWTFQDEVRTANKYTRMLKRRGVEAIVVLLHEGGEQSGSYNDCVGISGPVVEIAEQLHSEIDVVVTGHTHKPYNCVINDRQGTPRRVVSAQSAGKIITEIDLRLNRRTKDVRRWQVTAQNHVVTRDVAADADQTAIIAKWSELAEAEGSRKIGEITADITRARTPEGKEDRGAESNAANMIADAQLWATKGNGAQLAVMNPGGVRDDFLFAESDKLEGDGVVTYAEAYTVQPFGNLLVTLPMTGAQIKTMLEQQCNSTRQFTLGFSEGFTYDEKRVATGTSCTSIEVSNIRLNGEPVQADTTYLVTTNNFLAGGKDGFTVFNEIDQSQHIGGGEDLQALIDYFAAEGPIAPPGTDRVNELP